MMVRGQYTTINNRFNHMKKINMWMCCIAAVVLISGCSSKAESEMKKACKASVGDRTFCNCLYDRREKHYGEDALNKMADGAMPPAGYESKMEIFMNQCLMEQL